MPQPFAPTLRIGILTDAARPSIGADSGVLVWSGSSGAAIERPISVQRATFVVATLAEAGALPRAGGQRERRSRRAGGAPGRGSLGETAVVHWNDDTRTFQVRVGEYATREQAQAAATRLRAPGSRGSWIAEDGDLDRARIRLIETGQEYETSASPRAGQATPCDLDATEYRGSVEVRASANGKLTVVNLVNLEDYLRGVVPNELSPVAYPQIEALKAQAVAARTYALRNRGQYASQGYDLCATPSLPGLQGQVERERAHRPGRERDRGARGALPRAARSTPITRRPAAATPRTATISSTTTRLTCAA